MFNRFVILKDSRNFLYYGTSETLLRMDLRTGTELELRKSAGLINNGATDLFIDRENNLWVSGFRGISKIASTFFSSYRKSHGLLSNEVTAITEPVSGRFILGHTDGISILEDGRITTVPFSPTPEMSWKPPRVLDLAELEIGRAAEGDRDHRRDVVRLGEPPDFSMGRFAVSEDRGR